MGSNFHIRDYPSNKIPAYITTAIATHESRVGDRASSANTIGSYLLPQDFDFANIPATHSKSMWVVRFYFDLGGQTITIPEGVTISFEGGKFGNGTITGEDTKLLSHINQIFETDVSFAGTWNQDRIYPQWFGALADGSHDDTDAIKKSIELSSGGTEIYFIKGKYRVTSTLQIDTPNIKFTGSNSVRPEVNGSSIHYIGTVACIQIGRDNHPGDWAGNHYDGPQGFELRNMHIRFQGSTTALTSQGSYGLNVNGIVDWYGGHITMVDVMIEKFESNFFGVNSDINSFNRVTSLYSKYGFNLQPRSDQNTFREFYSFYCDTVIMLTGTKQTRFYDCQFVNCGSTTANSIVLTQGCNAIVFENCWFESYNGGGSPKLSHISIGEVVGYNGDTAPVESVLINHPFIAGTSINQNGYTPHFTRVNKATILVITNPSYALSGKTNTIESLINFVGTTTTKNDSQAYVNCDNSWNNYISTDSTTGGAFALSYQLTGQDSLTFASRIGRFYFERPEHITPLQDFYLSSSSAGRFEVNFWNDNSGNTARFNRIRRDVIGTSPPSLLTWERGDFIKNTNPTVVNDGSANYTIIGWTCTISGSPGTWVSCRAYTENPQVVSATKVQLELSVDSVNTTNKSTGLQVWNSTDRRPVFATGSSVSDEWVYGDGATAHTPL